MHRDNGIRDVARLSGADHERTRRSRDALLSGGLLTTPPGSTGIPPHIESSWRRCVSAQVPVVAENIHYRRPDDPLTALCRAAAPVLSRLGDSLADVPVAMVISDADGRIVLRRVGVRRQRQIMDRAGAAEGFDYSERSVGTNGIGTALVERRTVLVRGPEHYTSMLEELTCATTPVVEPGTGRLVGSFSLACPVRNVHPLMTVMASDVGRQIEERLLDATGGRRRRLIEAFLGMGRGGAGALVVDEDAVLANRQGLAHTGPELHPLLWSHLREYGPLRGGTRMQVPLSDGFHDALVEPVGDGDAAAFSVRLLPRPADRGPADGRRRRRTPGGALPTAGRLHFHDDVEQQLLAALRHGEVVAVTGAGGTGKLRTALQVLNRMGAEEPAVVEPSLQESWFETARAALAAGRGLVLRRMHAEPVVAAEQMRLLLGHGAPLVLTVDLDAAGDDALALVRQVATTVRLPALRQCREHLPSLVHAMLAELPPSQAGTRFAPAAWELLLGWHWPGNLTELRNTVTLLARRADGNTVVPADLPAELRTARRSTGLLESAERETIVEALRSAGGNRSRAARELGIGRNTLYRKMREFRIS